MDKIKETPTTAPDRTASSLTKQSFLECEAMARFALASGMKVSGTLLQQLNVLENAINQNKADADGSHVRRLGDCHNQLTKLVAPAKPRTILLLDSETAQSGILQFLGPVPLIRQMMVASLLSLMALIALTLSPQVNGSADNSDILIGSGMPLLLNELFLLSAAALGASFAALFTANSYIQEGTFDPKYNIAYWIRFVLGLIAGFTLATLIDFDSLQSAGIDASSHASAFARPLLAMLGGFSAAVVYRILNRLAESVESLFRGNIREQLRTQTEAERNQLQSESKQERSRLAYQLMRLQQKLSSDEPQPALKKELDTLMRELIGEDTTPPVESGSADTPAPEAPK